MRRAVNHVADFVLLLGSTNHRWFELPGSFNQSPTTKAQGTAWLMHTAVIFRVFSAALGVALKIPACHLHQVDCFG